MDLQNDKSLAKRHFLSVLFKFESHIIIH